MTFTKTRIIVVLSFLVALAAGFTAGLTAEKARKSTNERNWLADNLNLTPEQQEQMRKIWSETMTDAGKTYSEERRALQEERDEAVRTLLDDDQRAMYEALMLDHSKRLADLNQERSKLFKEATERTKKILTPDQLARYEELLKQRGERPFGRYRGSVRGERRDSQRANPSE